MESETVLGFRRIDIDESGWLAKHTGELEYTKHTLSRCMVFYVVEAVVKGRGTLDMVYGEFDNQWVQRPLRKPTKPEP